MRRHGLVFVSLAALIAALYGVAIDGAFIFDDIHHIVDNPGIRQFGAIFDSGLQETRPVFLWSLAANYALGGLDPVGYRLVNLALHLACAALVYALAVTLADDLEDAATRWFPEISAAIFAVHPLATESVTYINSRSGLLAACFGVAAILLYLRFDATRSKLAYAGAIACMAMAMGSKESAVVAPVLLFAYLWLVRDRGSLGAALRRAAAMAPLALCVAIVPVLFAVTDNPHRGTIGWDTLPVFDHALTQLRVHVYFVYLLFVPVDQNLDYDFAVTTGVDAAAIGAGLVLVAMLAVAWRLRRRLPVIALGALWWFIALAPTNSIVPFKDFIAERHLYLSLIGAALALGWALARAIRARRVALVAVIAYALSLSALTAARNQVLADPLALWTETVAASPGKARPHVNLGILLIERGRTDQGAAHLRYAVELNPRSARAQFNLGVYYQRAGQPAAALDALRSAVAVAPLRRYQRELARAANNAGIARFRANDLTGAEALFREATAAHPDHAKALYNLAEVMIQTGRPADARPLLERALAIDPGYVKARHKLEQLD